MLQIDKTLLRSKIATVKENITKLIIGLNEHVAYAAKVAEITSFYFSHGAEYGFDEAVKLFSWIDTKSAKRPSPGEVVLGKIDFTKYVLCTYDATSDKWTDVNAPVAEIPVEGEPTTETPEDLKVYFYKHIESEQI